MSGKVRIGIVGCGGIANAHLEGYQMLKAAGCDHFEITAVCDMVPELTAKFAAKIAEFQGTPPRQFSSLDALLGAGLVDGVDVNTPHSEHHPMAIKCLEAGIHVLVEKPMGVTIRAARKMLEAANRTGKILSIAENSRRGLGQRAMTWLFNTNKLIGDPRMFVIENMAGPKLPLQPPPKPEPVPTLNWRYDKLQCGGGWTYDGGVHLMDSLLVYFGEIAWVYAEQKIFSPTYILLADGRKVWSEREDTCIATFHFKNGVIGSWTWGDVFPGAEHTRVAFYGERGYVLDRTLGGHTHTYGGGFIPSDATIYLPDGKTKHSRDLELEYMMTLSQAKRDRLFPHSVLKSVPQECHEFVDCIRENRQPEIGPQAGLDGLAVAAAIYESAFSGQTVRIDDVKNSRIDAYQRPIDQHWGLV